jgi:PAS domain S-box-containing protein
VSAHVPTGDDSPLLESADYFYEDAPVGYVATAPDGTILRCNRTFLSLSGYASSELVGRRRFYDLLPPGGKIYYETHYAPLLEMQDEVREIALEIIRADGPRIPVLVNARVRRDDAGAPNLIQITVFDASERRRYERELLQARVAAESRAAAASALEHVREGVVLVDDDERIVVLNAAAERLFDVPGEDVAGLPLASVVSGWGAISERIPVGRADPPADAVVVPLAVAGNTRWVAASGELADTGVVYTLRDVTAERRLDDFRDDIVAIVSHELRTPLAGVYGAAQTLAARGSELGEAQRRELAEMIVEQTGRLSRILEEVLFTRRIDSGDLHVERTTFDVAAVAAKVVEASSSWRNSRPVRFADLTQVLGEGDPALFEQVLVNLLDNAMKYGASGEEIVVRVERHRSSARLTVADDGPGVPAEDSERIFEKFFRGDPTQASGVAGTGLGLYITRELVGRMRGRVGLLPVERGATFFVDLPGGELR